MNNKFSKILIKCENEIVDDFEAANILAEYFQSTFTCDSNDSSDLLSNLNCTDAEIEIDENVLLNKLQKINSRKSFDKNDISPYLLKNCSSPLIKPLCLLFNQSLKTGIVPEIWRTG
ncbi:uncharacterized protein B4U79_13276, partial [Dinothrombium tinctorium]